MQETLEISDKTNRSDVSFRFSFFARSRFRSVFQGCPFLISAAARRRDATAESGASPGFGNNARQSGRHLQSREFIGESHVRRADGTARRAKATRQFASERASERDGIVGERVTQLEIQDEFAQGGDHRQ